MNKVIPFVLIGTLAPIVSYAQVLTPAQCEGDARTDTPLISKLIAVGAGERVQLPAGTCSIRGSLYIPAYTTLTGVSGGLTTLVQADGAGGSERLLYTAGDNVTIEHLVLDGNRANQTPDEHRAGVFVQHANTTIRHVRSRNFTGDGFYLYKDAINTTITYVRAHDNGRDGIALTGAIGANVSHSQFYDNDADQIDVEPGKGQKVGNLKFDYIIAGAAGQKLTGAAIVFAGRPLGEKGLLANNLVLSNSLVYGSIRVVYTVNAIVRNNVIANTSDMPALQVYRFNSGALVTNNTISQLENKVAWPTAVEVVGTSSVDASTKTIIKNNRIKVAGANGLGVYAAGISDVAITGNSIQGAGKPSIERSGVLLRATLANYPFKLVHQIGSQQDFNLALCCTQSAFHS
ncbi:right-handed parallel beta-helix repeat-containing protein [Crenothrix polyspora]|uniref:Right handed beta helix domain-containing protein n=1 Tax=Crenothrix polyspora TaxID=360316 RepID=A0A1R4H9I6_9GAMM|nr:right-handed parallel beta-helix repeat-containing protein [Crenothrix polyspora]SJM92922.1 exported hypothetical protein [Crenothrix polyspora]